jgi:hypothetical protein
MTLTLLVIAMDNRLQKSHFNFFAWLSIALIAFAAAGKTVER